MAVCRTPTSTGHLTRSPPACWRRRARRGRRGGPAAPSPAPTTSWPTPPPPRWGRSPPASMLASPPPSGRGCWPPPHRRSSSPPRSSPRTRRARERTSSSSSRARHPPTVLSALRHTGERPPPLDPDPDRPVAIVFTSGTTGLPKGALFAGRQLAFITGDRHRLTAGAAAAPGAGRHVARPPRADDEAARQPACAAARPTSSHRWRAADALR